MKLLDLHLLRFGPFTDRLLDFASDGANLHVIFGSNEAGKSTTLRAVSGLLFGIPERTQDHHVHDMRELRIGARLENRRGERLHMIRRKGRKDTLLDANEQPLADTVLDGFLGGVGRELFETMFGLSHEALVQGGQELLQGRGELGESLFGAGVGVRGIHAIRSTLKDEAEKIFTPGAQKRPLNLALKTFQEAKRQANQLLLRPREWQERQEQLREAETKLAETELGHAEVLTELNRLKRLQRVLPRLRTREELLERQSALGEVTLVSEICTAERTRHQQILLDTEGRERKCRDEQQRCEQERAALQVPESLLAQEVAIENLYKLLGAHLKAANDLPGLEEKVAVAHQEAREILRELGREESVEEAERLRVGAAVQERIRRLGQEGTRLTSELGRARRDLAEIEKTLRELQDQRDRLPAAADGSALRRALAEARRHGDLEAQIRTLDTEIGGLRARAENQLAALLLWQGPLEDAAALPLPPAETVERFREDFQQLGNQRQLAKTDGEKVRKQLNDISGKIAALEGQGAVPSEAELGQARSERETHWREIRSVWLDGEAAVDKTPELLAGEYEQGVRHADEVADRLWRDAERAARHATLSAERDRYAAEAASLDATLEAIAKQETELAGQWRALWQPAGIEPLPPAEMRSWLGRQEKLVEAIAQCRDRERHRDALLEQIAEHRDRCGRELAALGERAVTTDESFGLLLQRADEVVAALDGREQSRQQILRDFEKAARKAETDQEALSRCESDLAAWRERWQEAVQPLGLEAGATSEDAEVILSGLTRLFRKLEEANGYRIRIEQIGRDSQRFAEQVAELIRVCAPDLDNMAPEAAAAELVNRLKKGKDDRKDRNNLDTRLKQLGKELDELRRNRESAQEILNRLMAEAGVASPAELEEAEARSLAYRDIDKKLADLNELLLSEGLPLETLLAEAHGVDPDSLPGEIARREETGAAIGRECTQHRERIWSLKNELGAMDGRSQAAEAATEAQEALAEIKTQVETYARLKLSALLLGREIERYRERNQGPIVQRAGELFRQMTLGAFSELSTGFGEGDQMVLLCVRDDGRKVAVDGLSEGTRDQLYLALRLASLEQHIERHEPPPLIVDDILINFDDRRARATLALLGELAEKMQVLFFTHHRQLLELARDAIPVARLKEHDLDRLGG